MLGYMEDAVVLDDLAAIPGARLELLKGKRKGQYSLQVSGNWRLCFVWRDECIYDLELVDYH